MKKQGKRCWALLLACWMVVSAAVPAYAAQSGGEVDFDGILDVGVIV